MKLSRLKSGEVPAETHHGGITKGSFCYRETAGGGEGGIRTRVRVLP